MGVMPYGGDPWCDMCNSDDTTEEAGAGMCGTHDRVKSLGREIVRAGH